MSTDTAQAPYRKHVDGTCIQISLNIQCRVVKLNEFTFIYIWQNAHCVFDPFEKRKKGKKHDKMTDKKTVDSSIGSQMIIF